MAYRNQFGFGHFGLDLISTENTLVYGSGDGIVAACGYDRVLGNVIVIQYDRCLMTDGVVQPLILRYYHLSTLHIQKGQFITKDTRLGLMGKTGQYSTGIHLHVEVDIDVFYPCFSPTLSGGSTIIQAGIDTTVHPCSCLYVKATRPIISISQSWKMNFLPQMILILNNFRRSHHG